MSGSPTQSKVASMCTMRGPYVAVSSCKEGAARAKRFASGSRLREAVLNLPSPSVEQKPPYAVSGLSLVADAPGRAASPPSEPRPLAGTACDDQRDGPEKPHHNLTTRSSPASVFR